jgi:hypothetical protein
VNKRLVLFVILIAAFVLSAINPWPSVLTIYNWTGDNIYLRLKYCGEQKYFLTAHGDSCDQPVTFDLARKKYSAEVTACGVTTTSAKLDMNHNLKLTFTDCDSMRQWWTPKYWGEPSMEKPNFYQDDYTWKSVLADPSLRRLHWNEWKFKYSLPEDYDKTVILIVWGP